MSHTEADDDLRLLAVGDVHLGTRPTRLANALAEGRSGLSLQELTPAAALEAAVDTALEQRVSAVLFAGDLVESSNARFEALVPLERAVQRLRAEGVRVLAVVGNHDIEALPSLAGRIEGLELLGAGGRWESTLVSNARGTSAQIVGWSFPQRKVDTSPLASLRLAELDAAPTGTPRLGLLHADLDASSSHYAPLSSADAKTAGLDAWLLGHIHKPSLPAGAVAPGDVPCGYLGSLVGLDPGEAGAHGPWLVRVSPLGALHLEPLAQAPLRWEASELQVDADQGRAELEERLTEHLSDLARELAAAGAAPKLLGLRVQLVGSSRQLTELRDWIAGDAWSEISRHVDATYVFLDKLTERLRPFVDLEALARGSSPPALLARKLLALERPGAERDALLESARARLHSEARASRWDALRQHRDASDPLSDDALSDRLLRSGRHALDALLKQQTPSSAASA